VSVSEMFSKHFVCPHWFLTVETVIRRLRSIINAKDQLMLHGDRQNLFILWLTSNLTHTEWKKDYGKGSEVGRHTDLVLQQATGYSLCTTL